MSTASIPTPRPDTSLTVTIPTGTIVTIPGYAPFPVGWITFYGDMVTFPSNGKRLLVHTGTKPQALKFASRLSLPAGKLSWASRAYAAWHTKAKVTRAIPSAPVVY